MIKCDCPPGAREVSYISSPKSVWLAGKMTEISVVATTVLLSLPGHCPPTSNATITYCSSSSSCSSTPVTSSSTFLRNLAACSTYRLLLSGGRRARVET